jgi:hypothetical protein
VAEREGIQEAAVVGNNKYSQDIKVMNPKQLVDIMKQDVDLQKLSPAQMNQRATALYKKFAGKQMPFFYLSMGPDSLQRAEKEFGAKDKLQRESVVKESAGAKEMFWPSLQGNLIEIQQRCHGLDNDNNPVAILEPSDTLEMTGKVKKGNMPNIVDMTRPPPSRS